MIPPLPEPTFIPLIASGFTSGITNGTPSVMRNALELSTTKHPFSTAIGPNFLEMDPPAEKSAMSMLSNELSVNSSVVYVSPSNSTFFPALLADANIFISLYGKSLCFNTRRNSCPTAPVTPAMHTRGPSSVFFAHVCTTPRRLSVAFRFLSMLRDIFFRDAFLTLRRLASEAALGDDDDDDDDADAIVWLNILFSFSSSSLFSRGVPLS